MASLFVVIERATSGMTQATVREANALLRIYSSTKVIVVESKQKHA